MVEQYPHYLFIEGATEESEQDENGNFTESEAARTFISKCRAETGGRGTEYQVAGGEYVKTTAVIQCPTSCPVVDKGTKVIVADDADGNSVRTSGVCLNFDAGQLHSRLWV